MTTASIRINSSLTDWLDCRAGDRQGDNCSPTLFSIFIDDLVREINNLNLGIDIGSRRISILLYADNIAMLANNETDKQVLLNQLHNWCKWSRCGECSLIQTNQKLFNSDMVGVNEASTDSKSVITNWKLRAHTTTFELSSTKRMFIPLTLKI